MTAVFVVTTALVVLAELGDKTQLLVLMLAARYKVGQVLLGVFGAVLALHLLSVAAGRLIGGLIPESVIAYVTGALFIGFGIWTLRGDDDEEEEGAGSGRFGPVLTTFVAFFLAELGDKTQIMSMTIAADPSAALRSFGSVFDGWATVEPAGVGAFLAVWFGATAGMMIADGAAVAVGSLLGRRLPERLLTRISGIVFILFGVVTIGAALFV